MIKKRKVQACLFLIVTTISSWSLGCPFCQERYQDNEFKSFVPLDSNGKPKYWEQKNKEQDLAKPNQKTPDQKSQEACAEKIDGKCKSPSKDSK